MRKVKAAATQMACTWNRTENLERAEALVRKAAEDGANVILLQELFETPYFCQQQKPAYMDLATSMEENPAVRRFREIAKELKVVLPISFYERMGNTAFNTAAIIDADGTVLGIYRKTHILGSVVSRGSKGDGADGCGTSSLSNGDRLGGIHRSGFSHTLAQYHGRARGRQHDSRCRVQ